MNQGSQRSAAVHQTGSCHLCIPVYTVQMLIKGNILNSDHLTNRLRKKIAH